MEERERTSLAKDHLPTRVWRVIFLQGYGFPECTRRELVQRTYKSPLYAARMVATIESMPLHHILVGVFSTRCAWEPVEELPELLTNEVRNADD